jgi:hypothetical protein
VAGGDRHLADVSARASIACKLRILAELHDCKSSFGRAVFSHSLDVKRCGTRASEARPSNTPSARPILGTNWELRSARMYAQIRSG